MNRPYPPPSALVRATLLVAALSVTLTIAHLIDTLADPAASSADIAMQSSRRPA